MSFEMNPIVTDTYEFPTLIKRGYAYVDKTALLHRLYQTFGMDKKRFYKEFWMNREVSA